MRNPTNSIYYVNFISSTFPTSFWRLCEQNCRSNFSWKSPEWVKPFSIDWKFSSSAKLRIFPYKIINFHFYTLYFVQSIVCSLALPSSQAIQSSKRSIDKATKRPIENLKFQITVGSTGAFIFAIIVFVILLFFEFYRSSAAAAAATTNL